MQLPHVRSVVYVLLAVINCPTLQLVTLPHTASDVAVAPTLRYCEPLQFVTVLQLGWLVVS